MDVPASVRLLFALTASKYQPLWSELIQIIVEIKSHGYSCVQLKSTVSMKSATSLVRQAKELSAGAPAGPLCMGAVKQGSYLQEGWVIANHILVSFHVAFISSVLAIPDTATTREAVLHFIFLSPETIVSALFTYMVFHTAIALHELGHFLEAARLRALSDSIQDSVEARLAGSLSDRLAYLLHLFIRIPYGRAIGIKREGLNYYPDAPYNLAVAAAGPRALRARRCRSASTG